MFVLSSAQFAQHLCQSWGVDTMPDRCVPRVRGVAECGRAGRRLLDIGAGDGNVTCKLAPYFQYVYATEFSAVMRVRLLMRGYTCGHPTVAHSHAPQHSRRGGLAGRAAHRARQHRARAGVCDAPTPV